MDIINSFAYLKDEEVIITGSKDNLLGMLQVDEFKRVYDTCPRFPVVFK